MKVKKLKELLNKVPDDLEVQMVVELEGTQYWDNFGEIATTTTTLYLLNERFDEDMFEVMKLHE